MKRKAGRVYITNELIYNTDPNELAEILKDLVIVRAQQDFMRDSIEYYALCDKFDEVDTLSGELPLYRIVINRETREVSYERVLL